MIFGWVCPVPQLSDELARWGTGDKAGQPTYHWSSHLVFKQFPVGDKKLLGELVLVGICRCSVGGGGWGLMNPFCFIWDQRFGERSARAGCSQWHGGKQLCSLLLPLFHVQLDSALGCSPGRMEESTATGLLGTRNVWGNPVCFLPKCVYASCQWHMERRADFALSLPDYTACLSSAQYKHLLGTGWVKWLLLPFGSVHRLSLGGFPGLGQVSSCWGMARDKCVGEPGWLISWKADVPAAASSPQVSEDSFTHICVISQKQQGSNTAMGNYRHHNLTDGGDNEVAEYFPVTRELRTAALQKRFITPSLGVFWGFFLSSPLLVCLNLCLSLNRVFSIICSVCSSCCTQAHLWFIEKGCGPSANWTGTVSSTAWDNFFLSSFFFCEHFSNICCGLTQSVKYHSRLSDLNKKSQLLLLLHLLTAFWLNF